MSEKKCLELIKKYTGHEYVFFTKRANKSILAALRTAKRFSPGKESIIIPDQGGWLTYKQSPKKIKMVIDEVRTDYGIIDLEDLKRLVSMNNCAAFIYSNPAGYFAHQPISEIYRVCESTVILDVSGCLGNERLCKGEYSDIMVGSFGKSKPVNAGKGGFISFRNSNLFDIGSAVYEEDHGLNEKDFSEILVKLQQAPERIRSLESQCRKIKKDLKDLDIIHPKKEGLNVIIRFRNEEEKNRIIEYCENNKYEFTECPRYIRVNENAISIEVKRR